MNHLLFIAFFISINCSSQENKHIIKNIDLSGHSEMNYIFARIYDIKPISMELYGGGLFISVFQISDSKATPENFFEGYDSSLSSYIISVKEDGDYYTGSKLYKIEGLEAPKVLEIKETKYPKFTIKIEHGAYTKRKTDAFEFEGI